MAKSNITKTPSSITWKAHNSARRQRSAGWYIGFVILAVAFMAFAIYSRSITTIATFAVMIVAIFFLGLQKPKLLTIRITKTGIDVGNLTYSYQSIKNFWIVYNPPDVKTLNLLTTAYINNQVVLELDNQDPILVKLVLSQYIPEDLDREESLAETLARRLKI